jgi:predicted DNA repair protein MutK
LLVKALPWVIKALGIIGTIALILVAGGIFDHNIDYLHHALPTWSEMLKQVLFGLTGGLIALFLITGGKKVYSLATKK